MRFLSLFLLFFTLLYSANEAKNLEENKKIQEQINKKLEDLASDIIKSQKNLDELNIQISALSSTTAKLENNAKSQLKELNELNAQNKELLKSKALMEKKLVDLIAKNYAYDLAIPQGFIESKESFMAYELLNELNSLLKNDIYKLSKDYEGVSKLIDEKQGQVRKINLSLKDYNEQLDKLSLLKNKQVKTLKDQQRDKQIYLKKLDDLKKQQDQIRTTLNELKIIKEEKEPQNNAPNLANTNNQKVRQIGSSYQSSKVAKYTGKKTIAPLESFSVKQKFGNFVDPIYNLKIFNENVVLRSKKEDAVVKSVLDGKIVFAKDTSMLKRVIIVEHNNGIHTIYAHLDKIAPTAKVGKKVKKGEILGRIKNDLTFEVTQKNFHINPLELISLN